MKRCLTVLLILVASTITLTVVAHASSGESLSYRGTPDAPAGTPREEMEWGANPFAAQTGKDGQWQEAPPLTLSAIFYNPRGPSAIINERIVYKGSVIEGQKVVDIGKTHVILQWKGKDRRLDINAGPAKPPMEQGAAGRQSGR